MQGCRQERMARVDRSVCVLSSRRQTWARSRSGTAASCPPSGPATMPRNYERVDPGSTRVAEQAARRRLRVCQRLGEQLQNLQCTSSARASQC